MSVGQAKEKVIWCGGGEGLKQNKHGTVDLALVCALEGSYCRDQQSQQSMQLLEILHSL